MYRSKKMSFEIFLITTSVAYIVGFCFALFWIGRP